MKTLTLKFEVKEHKTLLGKKTGKVSVRMGEHEIFADNMDDLKTKALEWVESASRSAQLALVKVGDEIRLLTEDFTGTTIYKPYCQDEIRMDGETKPIQDGLVKLTSTTFSSRDILDEVDCTLVHLLTMGDTIEPPKYLRPEAVEKFNDYQKLRADK